MSKQPLCITTQASDLQDGLFGHVVYHVFQILPYLDENDLLPAWEIRSSQYGEAPDYLTIPGVFDLAYMPAAGPHCRITLGDLRRQQGRILGNDWAELSRIWKRYFSIPQRVLEQADRALPAGRGLGIHYRGNDKLTTLDDSNMFTQADYLTLVAEFLKERAGDFDFIFAATDEFSFISKLRASTALEVVNLGEVGFHKAAHQTVSRRDKADRALLDSVLLSRCRCVLKTSSALPSFAKVFNPELEIYRCAASKLFQDFPYFPVAYIPVLPAAQAHTKAILESSLAGDWTFDPKMDRHKRPFTSIRRKPLRQIVLRFGYWLGAYRLIHRIVAMRNRQIIAKLNRNKAA